MKNTLRKQADHHITIINTIDDSRYIIRHPQVILSYLKQIKKDHAFLAITSSGQYHPFISMLYKVDEQRRQIIFDTPEDSRLDRHFLKEDSVTIVTSVEQIRIQFEVSGLRHVMYDSKVAYAADIPTSILRLQRRDVYRLTVPVSAPIYCEIGDSTGSFESAHRYPVYDISLSGIGLNNFPMMAAGTKIYHAIVYLPDSIGSFIADLVVCHTFSIRFRRQDSILKTGFKFLSVSEQRNKKIQQYLNMLFSERRLREIRLEKKPISA